MIVDAHYTNAGHTAIAAEFDGTLVHFPAMPGNRQYDALVTAGIQISSFEPAAPTVDDVRSEASRRMQAVVGARDAAHLEIVIANATREAVRLLRKGEANWTAEEAARAAALEQVDAMIESIRAASNALEGSPPRDYTDDRHWP